MSVTMKLMRTDGNNADLSEWGFGSSEIDNAITKEFEKRMDVFFSETGIEIAFGVDLSREEPEEIILYGEVFVNQDGKTYAHGKGDTTIRELLREGFAYLGDETDVVVSALRKMADEIEQRGRNA